jgi:cytosolic phospholipase A2
MVFAREKSIFEHPYKDRVAFVRQGNELCEDERNALAVRKTHVKKALESVLGYTLAPHEVPTIACVTSGGGLRSFFSTLGFLKGLDQENLLDTVSYISSLSGSTWLLGTWLSLGIPFSQFYEYIATQSWQGLRPPLAHMRFLWSRIHERQKINQPTSMADFFGLCLAYRFFHTWSEDYYNIYLSEQQERIASGKFPFPIYTAISADECNTWYEFTPFEIGSPQFAFYVPTWAYGRVFSQGISLAHPASRFFPCEPTLGVHFGTFGAAFTGTLEEMYTKIKCEISNPLLHQGARMLLPRFGKRRMSTARVHNFMAGLHECPCATYKYLNLSDAGFAFNLPYPPVSGRRPERKVDILIIMDSSRTIKEGFQLQKIYEYAQRHNLALPPLLKEGIEKRAVTVLENTQDPQAPTIIYFPRVKDEQIATDIIKDFDPDRTLQTFCRSINFHYNPLQVQQVSGLMECNVRAHTSVIIQAIHRAVQKKRAP